MMAVLDLEHELQLVARCTAASAADRELAFRELYERFRQRVFSLCLHLTGRADDAQDAMQEVFLALFRSLPQFRGEARLSTWMFRITLRVAHRVRSRRPRDAELIDPEQPSKEMTASAPAHEEIGLVRRALEAVSAESRAVLALFAVEGLTHKEVAAILGVPEGTVWSRLHKAKKAMAAELARLEAA